MLLIKENRAIYSNYLCVIRNINLGIREVDVISCLIHNRGEKKIASLLFIAPNTVKSHTQNIMRKLNCNSREAIIDIIETSGKLEYFRQYYTNLSILALFKNTLFKIAKIYNKNNLLLHINSKSNLNLEKVSVFQQLKQDLKLANVSLLQEKPNDETEENIIKINISAEQTFQKLTLIFNKYEITQTINFQENNNYYFAVIDLLINIIEKSDVQKLGEAFKNDFNSLLKGRKTNGNSSSSNINVNLIQTGIKKNLVKVCYFHKNYTIYIITPILLCIIFSYFISLTISTKTRISNLIMPHHSFLLQRNKLVEDMHQTLKGSTGVRTILISGISGIGKTTLARLYASKTNAEVVWEINSENQINIINSLENLGYSIALDRADAQHFQTIQAMSDLNKKTQAILCYIKNHLKTCSSWILIFDNVKSFLDIKDYMPYDTQIWGIGKVILTTRNHNMVNNKYISNNQKMLLKELNEKEQFELFTRILNSAKVPNYIPNGTKDHTYNDKQKIQNFLKQLPPFPLDISIAAHYISSTGITFDEYLELKNNRNEAFVETQTTLLTEKDTYYQNRYVLTSLSIQEILQKSPEFKNLLFYICTINSQNIPVALLEAYQNEAVVNKFLATLSQFSLITVESPNQNSNDKVVSLHRSVHQILYECLIKNLSTIELTQITNSVATSLETYIDKICDLEDTYKLKSLLPHIISFQTKEAIDKLTIANIKSKLGHIYWALYLDGHSAIQLLEQSLKIYKEYYPSFLNERVAYALGELGIAHKMLGHSDLEKKYLEQSLSIYKSYNNDKYKVRIAWIMANLASWYRKSDYTTTQQYLNKSLDIYTALYGPEDIKTSWVLGNLGRFYRSIGNYVKAKELLKKTITINEKHSIKNKVEYAWLVINLGIVYYNIGEIHKSKALIENGISLYEKYLDKSHIETAWAKIHLGIVYGMNGNWQIAEDLIQKSLEIYRKHYGINHAETGWALNKLGICYKQLKKYQVAKALFDEAMTVYKKHYGLNSVEVALLQLSISEVDVCEGNLAIALEKLTNAYETLKNKNSPKLYRVIRNLIDIYSKKAISEQNYTNTNQTLIPYTKVQQLNEELKKLYKANYEESSN